MSIVAVEERKGSAWKEFRSTSQVIDGKLVLHTGAQKAELDEVLAAAVPEATDTFKPIGHGVLLQEVVDAMDSFGLKVRDRAYSLAREGKRFFGLLEVAGHDKPDYGLVIGLRNSVDQSFPASVCTGSRVFVCDNLAFSAEVMINRKHTKNILRDLPQCVARAIGQIGALAERQEARFQAYKGRELTDVEVNDFLVRSVQCRALPVTKLLSVRDQFEKPAHEEHAQYGRSVWRLLNAYTETLKGGIIELPKRTQTLHGMFDTLCGVQFAPIGDNAVQFDRVNPENN